MTSSENLQRRLALICPVFNGEEFLEETLNSILTAVNDLDIEVIVVNDGSTDKTCEILNVYSSVVSIIHQENLGEAEAVNRGLLSTSADYILVVNSDDPLFTSRIFEGVEHHFDHNPDLVAWYPDWLKINSLGSPLGVITTEEYSDESFIGRFRCLPGPGTFFRRSTAIEIGGRRKRWKYVSDYDFWLRMSSRGRLERRPEVLAQWRMHQTSASYSGGNQMFEERSEVVKDFVMNHDVFPVIKRMALSNYWYFTLTQPNNYSFFHKKFILFFAFIVGGGRITESQKKVVIYLMLSPISPLLMRFVRFLKSKL
jgi:glycosyltransferase involved in cell wall biosynthesis